jgi:hypothetical protein
MFEALNAVVDKHGRWGFWSYESNTRARVKQFYWFKGNRDVGVCLGCLSSDAGGTKVSGLRSITSSFFRRRCRLIGLTDTEENLVVAMMAGVVLR